MTKFDKSKFSYHGGYLTYTGDYNGRPVWEAAPRIHPSNVGKGKNLFIARFKHKGPITKAKFLKELIANHTPRGRAMRFLTPFPGTPPDSRGSAEFR